MQMDLENLTKLLKNLHEELKTCMENKQANQPPDADVELSDPILLGDFIVDTYNQYLAAAKSACDHPIIRTLSKIEKLGVADPVEYDIRRGVGNLPRLHKMREVALATRQLLSILDGEVQTHADRAQREITSVMTLLANLGEQIGEVSVADDSEGSRQSVQHLVEEYNRYLEAILEATDDLVITKMFRPLEVGDEGTSPQAKLSEVRLAQSGLLSYLQKIDIHSDSTPASPRNPFGVQDVPNPGGEDVQYIAQTIPFYGRKEAENAPEWAIVGGPNDENGAQWTNLGNGDEFETIDGEWAGRWHYGEFSQDWFEGKARIKTTGDWVYILTIDRDGSANECLIEVRRKGNRLAGRSMNLGTPMDSSPWVGIIVDNRRIDGLWSQGRWDFRR